MGIGKKVEIQYLFEDNHLLIVNKPAGLLVQGDQTGDETLVEMCKHYLKHKYHKPGNVFLGLIHRLDRPVSGVIALARTSKSLERMNQMIRERKVNKTYWALVHHRPPNENDRLVHWLTKDKKKNMAGASIKPSVKGQKSELKYRLIARVTDTYLLEVEPLTGRPHQIRVQLAKIGCPIVGDIKYGFPKPNQDGNINLHARTLQFIHPVSKELMNIKARIPESDSWRKYLDIENTEELS
ncbi:MAG: RluA family pseudouridine synthase [Bacteroidetes bacterium]|nr:RluA family pseudouridine synthase [Bacteroidota bacterium]